MLIALVSNPRPPPYMYNLWKNWNAYHKIFRALRARPSSSSIIHVGPPLAKILRGGSTGGGGVWGLQPPLSYMVTPPLLLNSPSPFPAFHIGPEAGSTPPPPPPPAFRVGSKADSTPPLFVSGLKRTATPPRFSCRV